MNDRALKVLEQYELEITAARRGRGSYICETPGGLRLLSDYTGSENKALFENCVMEKIREGGYHGVDMILPNKEGQLISRDWEGNKYVVKEWYVGRECDTSSENEILAAVGNLARLHRLMQLEPDNEFCKSFTAQLPLAEIRSQNAELRKIRSYVRKKNNKCQFERLLLNCFEKYYDQALEAEGKLQQTGGCLADPGDDMPAAAPGSGQMPGSSRASGNGGQMPGGSRVADGSGQMPGSSRAADGSGQISGGSRATGSSGQAPGDGRTARERRGCVCHGDYNHHHVLMCGYEIATTNFEYCKFDFQVNDLYRFMRKILEKHDWNQRLGMRMLERYALERPISREERRLLYVRMLYPEKFRKLANHYYGSNKAWVSGRFLEKLENLERQEEKKDKFVKMLEK